MIPSTESVQGKELDRKYQQWLAKQDQKTEASSRYVNTLRESRIQELHLKGEHDQQSHAGGGTGVRQNQETSQERIRRKTQERVAKQKARMDKQFEEIERLRKGDHGPKAEGTTPSSTVEGQMPRKEVGQAVRETFDIIDSLHSVPEGLTKVPIKTNRRINAQAVYSYRQDPFDADGKEAPVSIEVNPDKSQHMELSFAHEYGHYLDSQVFNRVDRGSTPQQRAVLSALNDSNAAKLMKAVEEDPSSRAIERKYAKYYNQPHEQFARAYAQWVATKSDNDKMLTQVNEVAFHDNRTYKNSQWNRVDFAPISTAIDNLFRSEGMIE